MLKVGSGGDLLRCDILLAASGRVVVSLAEWSRCRGVDG